MCIQYNITVFFYFNKYLRAVGKLSTIIFITAAPPMLERATNTEDVPRIPFESLTQNRPAQQDPAAKKQNTERIKN